MSYGAQVGPHLKESSGPQVTVPRLRNPGLELRFLVSCPDLSPHSGLGNDMWSQARG